MEMSEKAKEKKREYDREYRRKNHDRILENRRRYIESHREQIRKSWREWYRKNKDREKIRKIEYWNRKADEGEQ